MSALKAIVWSNQFSIGDNEIDQQHKQIIELINQLIESPEVIDDRVAFGELLNKLMTYSKNHLEYEEKLLARINYPHFTEHKALHNKYLEFVSNLCIEHFTDGKTSLEQVLRFLKFWWENHILIEDMQYKAYL